MKKKNATHRAHTDSAYFEWGHHSRLGALRSLLLENLHRNFLSKSHEIIRVFKVVSVCFKMKIMMNLDDFLSLILLLYENGH